MFGLLYLGSVVSQTVERRVSGRLSNCLHEMGVADIDVLARAALGSWKAM